MRNTLLCGLYIKMPRIHRDQQTSTNIEMYIKTFYELRSDLKICQLAVSRPGLQETCRSKKIFGYSFLKKFFSHKHIILAMLTLESKINFLFFLWHHFLVARVVLTFLNHSSLCRFHQTVLHQPVQTNRWKLALEQLETRMTKKKSNCELNFKKLQKYIL